MKKYSVLDGLDVLKKYNFKEFRVTINSRAKRVVHENGTITCGFDEFSCATNVPHYHFHNSVTIYTDSKNFSLLKDENSISIVIPQVVMSAQDEFLLIKERMACVLKIDNHSVSFPFRRPSMGQDVSRDSVWEFIENNIDFFYNGPIVKEKLDMAFSMMKTFDVSFNESSVHSNLMSMALNYFPSTKFFSDGKFKNYTHFINSSVFNSNVSYYIGNRLSKNMPVNDICDILDEMRIPKFLKNCFENANAIKFLKSNSWSIAMNYLHLLDDYPIEVQNLLLHYCINGDITIENACRFARIYQSDMFNEEDTILAFRKFLIKDYKRLDISDFYNFVNSLKEEKIVVNSRTANIRFMSSMENRMHAEEISILPDRLDVFEELLERDALKAIQYLRAH